MATRYLDYVNGSDANDGSSWALAWKTLTLGATAARIAAGDIIRVAKSPAPTSLGMTATWTNLSKTVTLNSALTANISTCESNWTAIAGGDCTPTLVGVATDAKQGSNCVRLTLDSAVQTNKGEAYFATGTINLSAYQKISFWIRNSAAILATHYTVRLCSDTAGVTAVDTFIIPAIPSTGRWVPLTIARNGGGNLGSSIQSIAIYTDSVAPTNSSNILIDNFIACTTSGLNLQSLISKNSAEQGGSEGWFGIQSINGTTVLLDNETNTKANAGEGYFGTTETVTTYIRETIKTAICATSGTVSQEVMDSGTSGNNIQVQGGYDTGTGNQTGDTFFDGLNGFGYGIQITAKSYITLNYLACVRYGYGIASSTTNPNNLTISSTNLNNNTNYGAYLNATTFSTLQTIINANNNGATGIYLQNSQNNSIVTITNANSNLNGYGFYLYNNCFNNKVTTITNACNNTGSGVGLDGSSNNTFTTLSKLNNNTNYGLSLNNSGYNKFITITEANTNNNALRFGISPENVIYSISTTGNSGGAIGILQGKNYIFNASIAEATEVDIVNPFSDARIFSQNHDLGGYAKIFTDAGNIVSRASTLTNGSGTEWLFTTETSTSRTLSYPLTLSIAKIACTANNLVTVKAWFKKGHATNIGAALVCRGSQIAGVASDVITTKANDTNEEELTITFTPTVAGVVEIEAWAYYIAGHSTVIVDAMTITQA